MLTYRRIEKESQWPAQIWAAEAKAPAWYVSASRAWTPDFAAFEAFWSSCPETYGLFDADWPDELLACVYLERLTFDALNIHISVIAKVEPTELVRFFCSLRRLKSLEGVRFMQGWLPARNRGMIAIAQASGFTRTGLQMLYGKYGENVIKWIEMRG